MRPWRSATTRISRIVLVLVIACQILSVGYPRVSSAADDEDVYDVAWSLYANERVFTAPVVAGDRVVIGDDQGVLHILDARTGLQQVETAVATSTACAGFTRTNNSYRVNHAPVADGTTLYVVVTVGTGNNAETGDDLIAKVDAATGAVVWCNSVGSVSAQEADPTGSPLIPRDGNGTATGVVVTLSDAIYRFRLDSTGAQATPNLGTFAAPGVDALFTTATSGTVRRLSTTLVGVWDVLLDGRIDAAPTVAGDTVYVAISHPTTPGELVALDPENEGEERWRSPIGLSPMGSPVVKDGRIFVADTSGKVFVFDVTGQSVGQNPANLSTELSSHLVTGSENLYVGNVGGIVHRLTTDGASEQQINLSKAIAAPADDITGIGTATIEDDEFVYAVRADGAVFGLMKNPPNVSAQSGDSTRTGAMPGPNPATGTGLVWRYESSRLLRTPNCSTEPLIVGGVLYYVDIWSQNAGGTCDDGLPKWANIVALDLRTMSYRWGRCVTVPQWINEGIIYADGHLFLATTEPGDTPLTTFHSFDLATGAPDPNPHEMPGATITSPLATDGEHLYFAALVGTEQSVYRLSLDASHTLDKLFPTSAAVTTPPVVGTDWIAVTDGANLYLSRVNGSNFVTLVPSTDNPLATESLPLIIVGQDVYAADDQGNLLHTNLSNPTSLVAVPDTITAPIVSIAATDRGIYVVDRPLTEGSGVYRFDPATGDFTPIGTTTDPISPGSRLSVVRGTDAESDILYVVTETNEIFGIPSNPPRTWNVAAIPIAVSVPVGSITLAAPIVWGGSLYVRDDEGSIYAFGSGMPTFSLALSERPGGC